MSKKKIVKLDEIRPIPGLDGYTISASGVVFGRKGQPLTNIQIGREGEKFLACNFKFRDKPTVTRLVHQLVALTFLPNPYGFKKVLHINGDRTDNRVTNLLWVGVNTSLSSQGILDIVDFHNNAKDILTDLMDGLDTRIICKKYNLTVSQVERIRYGRFAERYWNAYYPERAATRKRYHLLRKSEKFKIMEMLDNGESYNTINNKYDVRISTLSKVKHRKAWIKLREEYELVKAKRLSKRSIS